MSDETKEPKDTRGPAVAVTGSLLGGFKFHGPFDTIDSAIEWWMQTLCHSAGVTIALLEPPDRLSKTKCGGDKIGAKDAKKKAAKRKKPKKRA